MDEGLLSPVTVGSDAEVTDAAVLGALVAAEVALSRAWARVGAAPDMAALSAALGWVGAGEPCTTGDLSLPALAAASVAGGNPVIPLVGMLKERAPLDVRGWVHRGATSQDILDSALMLVARRAGGWIRASLRETEQHLAEFAAAHRDEVAAARTLTQHAVPTTVGARASGWLRAVSRARLRLDETLAALPAQLGGAGGTLASFVEIGGAEAAAELPAAYAAELGLAAPDAPWHVTRWPVTELADALVQTVDAVGKMATDVATLSRTEIGELAEGTGGGSSAMPQKQNPAASVLIRSAALRAPNLGATMHLAAALAADERPDGAWHAEWPTLRELLRLALGATATAARLVAGLRVDGDAVARNLGLTEGLIVSERLSLVLTPLLGKDVVAQIVADAGRGGDLRALVVEALEAAVDRLPGAAHPADGVDALLDPAQYTGAAGALTDAAVRDLLATLGEERGIRDPDPDPGAAAGAGGDAAAGGGFDQRGGGDAAAEVSVGSGAAAKVPASSGAAATDGTTPAEQPLDGGDARVDPPDRRSSARAGAAGGGAGSLAGAAGGSGPGGGTAGVAGVGAAAGGGTTPAEPPPFRGNTPVAPSDRRSSAGRRPADSEAHPADPEAHPADSEDRPGGPEDRPDNDESHRTGGLT
ncbi:adenylosuccinate lyase [Microbacterium caowuchunii]|uniref:Adenylosuccinate lyase n=1 Tax=Microbacterium caowuchunii TaxID=2614638 RepID=A0A5N0TBL3_9MICO|nr:adenylosuccinate lyase [Microbacterium caowuchunii]